MTRNYISESQNTQSSQNIRNGVSKMKKKKRNAENIWKLFQELVGNKC